MAHLNSVCDAFADAAFTGFSNKDACTQHARLSNTALHKSAHSAIRLQRGNAAASLSTCDARSLHDAISVLHKLNH